MSENVVHRSEVDAAGQTKATAVPEHLRTALNEYSKSPIGSKVMRHFMETGWQIEFIETADPTTAFRVPDKGNSIRYTNDIDSWKASLDRVPGDAVDSATLDVLIAHEFGHTEGGRSALGLPLIKDPAVEKMSMEDGMLNITYSFDRRPEEIRTIRLFENPYRSWKGIDQRTSYSKPDDVLNWNQ